MDPYEQDREDNGVREQWAEDHGYSRYRCPKHGTFWSDSGDHCESCPDEDGRYDLGEVGDDGPTPEHYGDSVEDEYIRTQKEMNVIINTRMDSIRLSAKEYNKDFLFFMDAMKRNGVL